MLPPFLSGHILDKVTLSVGLYVMLVFKDNQMKGFARL